MAGTLTFCHATAEFTRNVGDIVSCPKQYFTEYVPFSEIDYVHNPEGPVIFGGGGFSDNVYNIMLAVKNRPKIIWGMGTNVQGYGHRPHYLRDFDTFDLVGCRDWGSPYRWVPCVSCMSPLFDKLKDTRIVHEVVVYEGWVSPIYSPYPTMANHAMNGLIRCLRHIASGAIVVTNSYHGIYWAHLLGRKAAGIWLANSKFPVMRYPVPNSDNVKDAIANAIAPGVGYLAECRAATLAFRQEVNKVLQKHGIQFTT